MLTGEFPRPAAPTTHSIKCVVHSEAWKQGQGCPLSQTLHLTSLDSSILNEALDSLAIKLNIVCEHPVTSHCYCKLGSEL